jgi:SOUL heme-binding protein
MIRPSSRFVKFEFFIMSWLTFLLGIGNAMAIEEPKYSLTEKSNDFEIRAYNAMVVAETLVEGNLDQASSDGFKRIADYIFGNNTARNGSSEKIGMTAPVTFEPKNEKISMTTPVTMLQDSGKWRIYFVMPSKYTLETIPTPNNKAVTLRALPARNFAVLRFSGLAGEEKTANKTEELLSWLKTKNIVPIGSPELARYNPPWTLPFLRRNEMLVQI